MAIYNIDKVAIFSSVNFSSHTLALDFKLRQLGD